MRRWANGLQQLTLGVLLSLAFVIGLGCTQERKPPQDQAQTPSTITRTISRDTAYAGFPKNVSHRCKDIKRLENIGFVIGYCEELKNPVWVVYRLAASSTQGQERPRLFSVDERTIAKVSHNDYTNTGYDRGHMVPNHAIETRYGREAQLQTFLMSNICPQKPNLNRKVWQRLEAQIADDYAERLGEVWVITGPIFGERIGRLPSGVAIPEAFFMVMIDEDGNTPRTRAYIAPQDVTGDEPTDPFLATVDEVERRTGLDFMWVNYSKTSWTFLRLLM